MKSRPGLFLTALLASPLLLLGPTSLVQAYQQTQQTQTQQSAATQVLRAGDKSEPLLQREVSFTVQNVNNSNVRCESDGETYTVRGHITGPLSQVTHPSSVTLFLHGLSYGEFFTNYTEDLDYNFAYKQAEAGHVTVTIDRLGYDSSDKPIGTDICFGSRADIAHQMVLQLRSGDYQTKGVSRSVAFEKVVLAGHSVGAIIAQVEAYSFGDIDGLMVLSYSDTTVSPAAQAALDTAIAECQAGGDQSEGDSGPTGYVYFGAATPEQFIAAHFYLPGTEPTVAETTAQLRNRDPCGDITSYVDAVATNLINVSKIDVPVLVLIGGQDAIYPIRAIEQASLLTGSDAITAVNIPDTGHALTAHTSRDEFSSIVSSWLVAHEFGPRH